jgi:hypothetical protein
VAIVEHPAAEEADRPKRPRVKKKAPQEDSLELG